MNGLQNKHRKKRTKQEAIKAASNLLQRIYHDDGGVPNEAAIAILNAEAEENVYYLWSALEEVVKFCKKLQEIARNCKKQ